MFLRPMGQFKRFYLEMQFATAEDSSMFYTILLSTSVITDSVLLKDKTKHRFIDFGGVRLEHLTFNKNKALKLLH